MLKKISLSLLAASTVLTAAFTTAPTWGQFNSCSVPDTGGSSGYTAHVDVWEFDPIVAFVDITLTDSNNVVVGGASFDMHPSNYNTLIDFKAGGYRNFIAPGFPTTWGDIGQGSCNMGYGTI